MVSPVRCPRLLRYSFILACFAALLAGTPGCRVDGGKNGGSVLAEPLGAAIDAIGGLAAARAVVVERAVGSVRFFEPGQTFVAGEAPRFYADLRYTQTVDRPGRNLRADWDRAPPPSIDRSGPYVFTDVVSGECDNGIIDGRDGFTAILADRAVHPSARVAALRALERLSSPLALLLAAADHPGTTTVDVDVVVDGSVYDVITVHEGVFAREPAAPVRLFLNTASHLVVSMRVSQEDPLYGEVEYVIAFADWRTRHGVEFPFSLTHRIDGVEILDDTRDEVVVNPALSAGFFDLPSVFGLPTGCSCQLPPLLPQDPPHYARGERMAQWYLRMRNLGIATTMDPDLDKVIPLVTQVRKIAPGISLVATLSHHMLAIEMSDHLVVVEAPISPGVTRAMVDKIRERFSTKPIGRAILTHHHHDHAGGVRALVDEGATLMVAESNRAYFAELLGLAPSAVEGVEGGETVGDGTRKIELREISDTHVESNLLVYVPDARILFNSDLTFAGAFDPNLFDPSPTYPITPGLYLDNARLLLDEILPDFGAPVGLIVGGHGIPVTPAELQAAVDASEG